MAWRVARSLLVLRDQMDAAFPGRSRVSDGYIGDTAHQNTSSDHNPWYGPGIVTAADWTHDPRNGFDIDKFTDQLQASRDGRIKYVIANGWIMDSRPQFSPWQWVRYYGSNPHTSHVHVSVVATPACDDMSRWNVPMLGSGGGGGGGGGTPSPSKPPYPGPYQLAGHHYYGLKSGPAESIGGANSWERPAIKAIQQKLVSLGYARRGNGQQVAPSSWATDGWSDGVFEQLTKDAVIRFQQAHRRNSTSRWGEVWGDDWQTLWSL
jgi:hypothetical protein